jgi:putative addiction module antidote
MSVKLKIIEVGNSLGIILPEEMLEKLGVSEGNTLYAIETARGLEIVSPVSDFAKPMEIAERVIDEHRDVLRRLAD